MFLRSTTCIYTLQFLGFLVSAFVFWIPITSVLNEKWSFLRFLQTRKIGVSVFRKKIQAWFAGVISFTYYFGFCLLRNLFSTIHLKNLIKSENLNSKNKEIWGNQPAALSWLLTCESIGGAATPQSQVMWVRYAAKRSLFCASCPGIDHMTSFSMKTISHCCTGTHLMTLTCLKTI
jgi:hypothetical protein